MEEEQEKEEVKNDAKKAKGKPNDKSKVKEK